TTQNWRDYSRRMSETAIRELTGDYRAASDTMLGERWFQPVFITAASARNLAYAHDPKAAAARIRELSHEQQVQGGYDAGSDDISVVHALAAMGHEDWQAAIDALLRNQIAARAVALQSHNIL